MKKGHYLPKSDKDREKWLDTFATEFAASALNLGFTAPEIAEVSAFAAAYSYVLKVMNIYSVEDHEWIKYKDLLADGDIGSPLGSFPSMPTMPLAPDEVPAGIFKKIAKIVQRIKNHPNYNDSIGKNLGIIGPEKIIDYENAKVKVRVRRSDRDGVVFDFVKGVFDGVVVYAGVYPAKTNNTNETSPEEETNLIWTEIGRVATSHYWDKRPNVANKPETRHYMMRYLMKQVPVGKESDTLTVIVNAGTDLANKLK